MVTLQLLHKPCLYTLFSINSPQQQPYPPPSHRFNVPRASASSQKSTNTIRNRRQFVAETAAAAAATISFLHGGQEAFAAEESLSEWERVYLPIDPGVVLLDIAFVPDDPAHG